MRDERGTSARALGGRGALARHEHAKSRAGRSETMRRGSRWWALCLAMLAPMAAGCGRGDGVSGVASMDAGPSDAELVVSGTCTLPIADWDARCRGDESRDCAALRGAEDDVERARAHARLVLGAAPALGELRFRAGPHQGERVAEVLRVAAEAELPGLSQALGLAFLGCVDRGVLARTTTTPACEGGGSVVGMEGAECAALDHACGRGVLDAAAGCCRASIALEGTVCATPEGEGACDAASSCVVGAPAALGRVASYAEVLWPHAGQPRMESWDTNDGVMIRVEEVWDEAALDEAPGDYAAMGWAQLAAPEGSPRVVLARLSAREHGVDGLLLSHHRPGLVSLYLHDAFVEGGTSRVEEVVIVARDLDELAYLGADGATIPEGRSEMIPCVDAGEEPADEEALEGSEREQGTARCERHEGYLRITGRALTAAFVPSQVAREIRRSGRMIPVPRQQARVPSALPPGPALCTVGATRACGCGTQVQRCIGGAWGPCSGGAEVCNRCDDDMDGRVDENGAALCNDSVACTLDACTTTGVCQRLPRTTFCRRGACTAGVCNGATSASGLTLDPRTRPAADSNGCSYDESDARCEELDGCACNGMARCDGSMGPRWNGVQSSVPATDPIQSSQASCRPRSALEPRYPPNDTRFLARPCATSADCPSTDLCVSGQCYPLRNGGCDTDRNACTVDDMCIEPNPATSTCSIFSAPGGAALRTAQQAILDLVSERSSSIDGLAVSCVANVLGQDLPPAPYNVYCRPDGRPCTTPFVGTAGCSVTGPTGGLGSAPTISCAAEAPRPRDRAVEGEVVGVEWTGSGFRPVTGVRCAGDPIAVGSVTQSCYRASCDGAGYCRSTSDSTLCTAATVGGGTCGSPFVCRGTAGLPGTHDVAVDATLWGQRHGSFVGCSRQACMIDEPDLAGCFPAGPITDCRACDPTRSDSSSQALTGTVCGGRGTNGLPCGRCSAGTCMSASNPTCG